MQLFQLHIYELIKKTLRTEVRERTDSYQWRELVKFYRGQFSGRN